MAITYSQTNNKITVTGYSEATPADFDDLYNADIGATNSRQLLDGVIDADPDTFSLDSQPRPADDLAVPIKISCTARGGATCDILGTDAWDNAVSETGIDISSGSATTTQRFKTVDANGITVDGLQNNDSFDIYQDRWGVIFKRKIAYIFGCFIDIGDGSTATWFVDTKKIIIADAPQFQTGHLQQFITVKANATCILGELVDENKKQVRFGCFFVHIKATSWWDLQFVYNRGTCYLYSCAGFYTGTSGGAWLISINRLWNFQGNRFGLTAMYGNDSLNRVTLDRSEIFHNNAGTNSDLVISEDDISLDQYAAGDSYVDNAVVHHTLAANCGNNSIKDMYLTNVIPDSWSISFGTNVTSIIYRRYTFDLQVLDKNNNPINTAAVKLVKGATEIDLSTDANGQITQQTLIYGYYDEPNGNTLQDDGDWTLTITATGYQTYSKKFTLDEKIDWRVAMLDEIPRALTFRTEREINFKSPERKLAFTASGREL